MLRHFGKNIAWLAGSEAGFPPQVRQHENKLRTDHSQPTQCFAAPAPPIAYF